MAETHTRPPHRSFQMTPVARGDAGTVWAEDEAIVLAVVQQVVLLMFLAKDRMSLWIAMTSVVAYWCFVVILVVRRARTPTEFDKWFLRLGIWPLFFVAVGAAMIMQSML